MKINPVIYGVVVLVIFFGIIFGFQAAGVWSTSGKVDSGGKAIQPSVDNPETIKGWMTLEQIVNTYNIPLVDLLVNFDLPLDTPNTTALKDLESDKFDTGILIAWLQNRNQSDGVEDSEILFPEPTQISTPNAAELSLETQVPTEHVSPDRTITGKTTFQDLIDWGVSVESIQKIIGNDLPPLSTLIKDYVIAKGLEFSESKTLLQAEVDLAK
jgi:hypothetical protein